MNCRAGGGCGRGSSPPATQTQEYHPGKFWKVHVQNGAFRGKIALYSNSKKKCNFGLKLLFTNGSLKLRNGKPAAALGCAL